MSESTGTTAHAFDWRDWLLEGSLALAVLVVGLVEATNQPRPGTVVFVVLGIAAGVLCFRRAPGAALTLVWVVAALQVLNTTPVLGVELAVTIIAFGCARWGRPATVTLSGFSIPASAGLAAFLVVTEDFGLFRVGLLRELLGAAYAVSDSLVVGAVIIGMFILTLPWLAGLTLRAVARAQRSEVSQVAAEADAAQAQRAALQAREIARLRDEQTRLARDVHDVVGHSLAVILAQAESAQYLPDDFTQLKETMSTIATSARSSLQDVRQVLSATTEPGSGTEAPGPGGLETLVDGIRASGQQVQIDEVGTARPMPPELELVSYRVLQEMLTNAVKHGRRDQPIRVERHWPEGSFERDLRIEVRNAEPAPDETQPITPDPVPGQGLEGMRRRVESVGGRIDVRRRAEADGPTFTATAWVPVRA